MPSKYDPIKFFGHQMLALLTFHEEWDSGLKKEIQVIMNSLVPLSREEVRRVSENAGLPPENFGDDLPRLTFRNPVRTAADRESITAIREAYEKYHDAHYRGEWDEEVDHAADLIEHLMTYARITRSGTDTTDPEQGTNTAE